MPDARPCSLIEWRALSGGGARNVGSAARARSRWRTAGTAMPHKTAPCGLAMPVLRKRPQFARQVEGRHARSCLGIDSRVSWRREGPWGRARYIHPWPPEMVGWLEVVIGRHTPTHRDKGLNLEKNPEFPGQLDCIDESLNITQYMNLFQEQGHMRRHRVVDRAYRRAGFDAHWAGQIEEVETGERFVIDSWFQDNGMLPYISPSTDWFDLTDLRILSFGIQD